MTVYGLFYHTYLHCWSIEMLMYMSLYVSILKVTCFVIFNYCLFTLYPSVAFQG